MNSIEIFYKPNIENQINEIPEHSTVNVATKDLEETLKLVDLLYSTDKVLNIVPHLPARLFRDEQDVAEFSKDLHEKLVKQILVVGGGIEEPIGIYNSALNLLEVLDSLELISKEKKATFSKVGIASYPEGHHLIADKVLVDSLKSKAEYADYITTQICFDPDAIMRHLQRLESLEIDLPLEIGILGNVDGKEAIRLISKYSPLQTMGYLDRNHDMKMQIVDGIYSPNELQKQIKRPLLNADISERRVDGFLYYTFNYIDRNLEFLE